MNLKLAAAACGVMLMACSSVGPNGTGGGGGSSATGGSSGSGGGTGSFPQQVRLQGTIELTKRTYDRPGGNVVISRTSTGTFNGVSTSSDSTLGRQHYSFTQGFTVTGTQTLFDATNNPKTCTLNISSSNAANLELYVASPTGSSRLAQLMGTVATSTTETCPSGSVVQSGFLLNLPSSDCTADPAIQTMGNGKWLVASGDPAVGFTFQQDFTCDSTIVKITASVQAL